MLFQPSYCFGGAFSLEWVIIQHMYFFVTGSSSERLLFQKMNFFRSMYFLKRVIFFLIVLRKQFYSIYTWKDCPLTSIHSFKYSIVWSDFEIPQSFIVGNSKQRINFNTGCVTNVSFWEFGSYLVSSSNKLRKIVRSTWGSKDVARKIC